MTQRKIRIEALRFIANIIEDHTDMDDHRSTPGEVIDEAYELCDRLKDEADEIEEEQATLDNLLKTYRDKKGIT